MRIVAFVTDPSTIRDILLQFGELATQTRQRATHHSGTLPGAGADGGDHHAQPAPEYDFDQRVAW